ncbi:AarF/ABC1/UbiB kinase family protein [Luteolibacter yonseiensis]|uniref:AarF/ABC1/UbiB kinase family protein n=1 Tax=Luteolibacter yonseiensis TaxID=1144680 RepID=A0A934R591_9BACT|nr:AarF/UbiB family protein [Luteolibacter yonseiensis]MBK1817421.1 AarF/ABC1/UbiB kinase family protein [Luteolibacter yonseiensis]
MKIAPSHLKRYKDVALLFYKYGRSDIFKDADLGTPEIERTNKGGPDELTDDLEKLGPTFVKIGQLLSTRADLLPQPYLDALSRLQDKVGPLPYEEIEKVVQDQLGVRISKAFESFEKKPLGAASLGQVHLATLRGGRTVAVKVQRPGIRAQIVEDLASLADIAEFIDSHTDFGKRYETARIVEHFRSTLMRELDYQKEALHLSELRRNLKEFHRLRIPTVVDDYSTSQVLTMEYLSGTKVTSLAGTVLVDLDGDVLAEELFRAYLQQILVDGFFHADPHPGNLLLTPERNIAILDLGMIGRMNQRMRDHLLHLLAGIADGDGVQTAEAAMKIGEPRGETIDRKLFINSIEEIVGSIKTRSMDNLQVGAIVLLVMQACADAGIRIPSEISLLGKTLMNLDRVGIALSPNFNPNESIRRHLSEFASKRLKESLTSANMLGALTETKEFLGELPFRMNRILEMVADNKLSVKVDSVDEHKLVQGLQKVANRITTGLILAAFIVGSSMLARVETSFRIFGYPGLAMIFFLFALVGAALLMVQILWKDE